METTSRVDNTNHAYNNQIFIYSIIGKKKDATYLAINGAGSAGQTKKEEWEDLPARQRTPEHKMIEVSDLGSEHSE